MIYYYDFVSDLKYYKEENRYDEQVFVNRLKEHFLYSEDKIFTNEAICDNHENNIDIFNSLGKTFTRYKIYNNKVYASNPISPRAITRNSGFVYTMLMREFCNN